MGIREPIMRFGMEERPVESPHCASVRRRCRTTAHRTRCSQDHTSDRQNARHSIQQPESARKNNFPEERCAVKEVLQHPPLREPENAYSRISPQKRQKLAFSGNCPEQNLVVAANGRDIPLRVKIESVMTYAPPPEILLVGGADFSLETALIIHP